MFIVMQTIWQPDVSSFTGPRYQAIAEALARDVDGGVLSAGQKLPTMRALAETLGVTVGTVLRAYALAERRGLVTRQLGRGSFVAERESAALGAGQDVIDLSLNEPVHARLGDYLRRALRNLSREADVEHLVGYGNSQGQPRHRRILADWTGHRSFPATPERMIVTGGAQQALTIALSAVARAGDTLLVEALTYPGVKNLAALFDLRLAPVAIDAEGLDADAFAAACRRDGNKILYCMPNLHNPTTGIMTAERRALIGEIADRHGVLIIEDDLYPGLPERRPPTIAELWPEGTIYITSLSKTVAPGLRIGTLSSPTGHFEALLNAAQSTNWMAPPLTTEIACRWIEDGTAKAIVADRKATLRHRHDIAQAALHGLPYSRDIDGAFIWLPLPGGWTGLDFAAEALGQRIRVAPGEWFAIDPALAPAGVRIGLGHAGDEALQTALGQLVELSERRPGRVTFRM